MVRIIPETERQEMRIDDIKKAYNGKWVFAVNSDIVNRLATPVIIADEIYEDSGKGIYDEFKKDREKYGQTSCIDPPYFNAWGFNTL